MDEKEIIKEKYLGLEWNISSIPVSESKNVGVERGCNGFTAINYGDTIAQVNDIVLFPSATPATVAGDSVSFGGNAGEIYRNQQIKVQFRQPLGATPLVFIIQKFYINFQ